MGTFVEVIAIGPYSRDILKHLEYDEIFYKNTNEGAIINLTLFGVREGTSVGNELADYLGISDVWDFNQHKITNGKIDLVGLRTFSSRYNDYSKDVETLIALVEKNFEFHFAPNG